MITTSTPHYWTLTNKGKLNQQTS